MTILISAISVAFKSDHRGTGCFVTLLFEPHVELTVLYASHDAINKKIFVCSAIVAMCDRQMLVVPIRVGRKRVNDLQERCLQPHRHLPFNPSGVVTAAWLGIIQTETEIRPLRAIFISGHFCGFSEYLGCQLEKYSYFSACEKPLDIFTCKNTSVVIYTAEKSHVVFHS